MTAVTVVSKQPPGGRCSLYLRYAETLSEFLGDTLTVTYCGAQAPVPPPALLIGAGCVAPSDGVIVSPEDIVGSLADRLHEPERSRLLQRLESTQDRWMEEWSNA